VAVVTFLGDSITRGQYVEPRLRWVNRLRRYWVGRGIGVEVRNAARNGETTRMALRRLGRILPGTDVLVVQYGLNDANCWESELGVPRVTPASYRANLEEILYRACSREVMHIFLVTNHLPMMDTRPGVLRFPDRSTRRLPPYRERVLEYNGIVRSTATDLRVDLVDVERDLSPHDGSLMLPDGIHLNREGHLQYHQVVRDALEPLECDGILGCPALMKGEAPEPAGGS
jgi:lysophospholipase L1-like esterase